DSVGGTTWAPSRSALNRVSAAARPATIKLIHTNTQLAILVSVCILCLRAPRERVFDWCRDARNTFQASAAPVECGGVVAASPTMLAGGATAKHQTRRADRTHAPAIYWVICRSG